MTASRVIYVGGSLRNPEVPRVGAALRDAGFEVYDEWYSPGPEADEKWQEYERARGRTYREAAYGWHAEMVFQNDLYHLKRCDTFVLVCPAGRSGHLELGWAAGQGKTTVYYVPEEPDRYDIMPRFATNICTSLEELIACLI